MLAAAVAALALIALVIPGSAQAHHSRGGRAVPAPPANPTRADQIQNLDQVKTAIEAYYGDTVSGTNPDGSPQHLPSPKSAYANEMHGIERHADSYLAARAGKHAKAGRAKAILLDVDDTTLNTYNYEIFSNFVYNPTSNAAFVNGAAFPAVFGMPQLVSKAKSRGLHDLLPDRAPRVAAVRHDHQPDAAGLPGRLEPALPEGPDEAVAVVVRAELHDDPVQVADP